MSATVDQAAQAVCVNSGDVVAPTESAPHVLEAPLGVHRAADSEHQGGHSQHDE